MDTQTANSCHQNFVFWPSYTLLCAWQPYEIFPGDDLSAAAVLADVYKVFFFIFLFVFFLKVARLVEMGFSRIDALEALRASNNDINMATNFLLQH